ncbi:hypothetical protein DV735_g1446, partial [Chaetothyriales sp. CBS 134920]
MPRGTFDINAAHTNPAHAPVYTHSKVDFQDVDLIRTYYYTSAEAVKHLIPTEFELEDEPLVTTTLVKWGYSPFGTYTEWMLFIEVSYNGTKYDYAIDLILENESAVFMGREQLGFPKVFGRVVFEPYTAPTANGFNVGHVERPVGNKIIHVAFRPEAKVQDLGPLPADPSGKKVINLRVLPNPTVGSPPSVREFVVLDVVFQQAEVWTGAGSLVYTSTSNLDVSPRIPVVRYRNSLLLRKGSAVISPNATVLPLNRA